jgi:hypothetical protein
MSKLFELALSLCDKPMFIVCPVLFFHGIDCSEIFINL